MPALMWVTFWSCLMGSAACWGETPPSNENEQPRSLPKESSNHPDHPAV
jgi:hypothetical protein